MIEAVSAALRWRVHWVIAELDAHGEVDDHAAMCLRHAIDAAPIGAIELVLVDLRDLAAIDDGGLALFARLGADCCARGLDLGLLLGGHEHHDEIAEALVLAGLGEQLRHADRARPPATGHHLRLLDSARSARRGRLARAAARCSPRRRRGSRVA